LLSAGFKNFCYERSIFLVPTIRVFLVPTLCVGMPSRTLRVLQECAIVLAGRGASMPAFPRRAWEREKEAELIDEVMDIRLPMKEIFEL